MTRSGAEAIIFPCRFIIGQRRKEVIGVVLEKLTLSRARMRCCNTALPARSGRREAVFGETVPWEFRRCATGEAMPVVRQIQEEAGCLRG